MPEGYHEIHVSAKELEYLKQLISRDSSLADMFKLQEGLDGRGATIRLNRDAAEQVRDYLTTLLAVGGFDRSYSPNEQGQMLEALIDRFYLR